VNPNSEVAGEFIGILTTMEAQRTWRNYPPPNPSSNGTDFYGFKNTPNRFENRFHNSFIIRAHPCHLSVVLSAVAFLTAVASAKEVAKEEALAKSDPWFNFGFRAESTPANRHESNPIHTLRFSKDFWQAV
jgi:hypothetical protein